MKIDDQSTDLDTDKFTTWNNFTKTFLEYIVKIFFFI